jgi:hypothetical protein
VIGDAQQVCKNIKRSGAHLHARKETVTTAALVKPSGTDCYLNLLLYTYAMLAGTGQRHVLNAWQLVVQ